MRHLEAGLLHRGQHGLRRRGGGGEEARRGFQRTLFGRRRAKQRRHHDRRATQMGDAMLGHEFVNVAGAHLAQTNMGSRHDRQRPWKAPAVAVEHRQRP